MFLRNFRKLCILGLAASLPCSLAAAGLGFVQGRRAPLPAAGASLNAANSVAEVCGGGSICFEFETTEGGPLWVLLQNRAGGTGRRARHHVLVSRTPSFENYLTLQPGSASEGQMLASLKDLGARSGDDARVQGNLELLNRLIAHRDQPAPTPANWYLY